jgi:hypothetical protein
MLASAIIHLVLRMLFVFLVFDLLLSGDQIARALGHHGPALGPPDEGECRAVAIKRASLSGFRWDRAGPRGVKSLQVPKWLCRRRALGQRGPRSAFVLRRARKP